MAKGNEETGRLGVVEGSLAWAHLDGYTEEELLDRVAAEKDYLEDAINDYTNLVRCCMARLTALHLARA